MKLPAMTQKSVLYVDATPDEGYPLRILRAYRQDAGAMWTDNTAGDEPLNPMLIAMNEDQRRRAEILDRAIAVLAQRG